MKIDITDAIDSIQGLNLSQAQVRRIEVNAINHTIRILRTHGIRSVGLQYKIPRSRVVKGITIRKASLARPSASIEAKVRPVTLGTFNPRMSKRGALVTIKRGRKNRIPSAFRIKKRGDKQIFGRGKYSSSKFKWRNKRTRTSGPDMPIGLLSTTSIAGMFSNDTVNSTITRESDNRLAPRILHEVDRILQTTANR